MALQNLSFRHAVASVAIGSGAFIILFAVLATHHRSVLHAAAPWGAGLFVVFFAGAVAVLALLRHAELGADAFQRPGPRPSGAWFVILALPMLITAGLGLALAAGAGPVAPRIGQGVAWLLGGLVRAVSAVARSFGHLFPSAHSPRKPQPSPLSPVRAPSVSSHAVASHAAFHVPTFVGFIVLLVAVAVLIGAVVRGARWLSLRRTPRAVAAPMEHGSLFSWRHLWEQLVALLGRLRRGRRPDTAAQARRPANLVEAARPGVRGEYTRFLRETARAGIPRRPEETPREFARRIHTQPSAGAQQQAGEVDQLTSLYDRVRYGGYVGSGRDVAMARSLVDQVLRSLTAPGVGRPSDE